MRRAERASCLALVLLAALGSTAFAQATGQKSKIISLAPEAAVLNGNDDIDPKGNCVNELASYCVGITAGEGQLADCISDKITESETGNSEEGASAVSDACREEVYQYKITRNTNINANIPLAKACKVDAEKLCNVTWMFGYKTGQVIACLRDAKDRLSPGCQKQVFKIQMDAAEDYRADAELHEACQNDAAVLCKDVKTGGGRIQACLRDQRPRLSMLCEEALYRQERENADDIRLSVRLFVNCKEDKKRFCADVEPGMARVKDCLEAHRTQPDFTAACKSEIDSMIERRVEDFALDSRLRETCKEDIYDICAFDGDLDYMPEGEDSTVIKCLQDYVQEIRSNACKQQVIKYKELGSEDVRFNLGLAKACYQDRQTYCGSVPPGSAQVIRCLMNQRAKISKKCRAVLFDEEVKFSENIDFQYPMKRACEKEIQMYCKDVPHGEARVIRCLQENKRMKDFGKECRDEVTAYEREASSDYRLNYRLFKSCRSDINSLCDGVCRAEEGQVCGGAVLRCLTDKREELKDKACQMEVNYYMKMEVTDYRNDLILAAACRADVEKFCSDVEPGEGRVHECLRAKRSQLSESCRREELRLEEAEAEDIELRPGIMRVCRQERQLFCKEVIAGQARMFRCLAEKMADPDFGVACRSEIMQKLLRRQANWKLDPPLRKACKASVQEYCRDVDSQQQEKGLVYKCLINQYEDLDMQCRKELGRALHMAFFVWVPGAILTSPCDQDIQSICMVKRPNIDQTPGQVVKCLTNLAEAMDASEDKSGSSDTPKPTAPLHDECRVLVDIAQPPDLKKAFEASLTLVMLKDHLAQVEAATGVKMIHKDSGSLTLTGWTALAGIAALIILIIWGAGFAWAKYRGTPRNKDYTLVVKRSHR